MRILVTGANRGLGLEFVRRYVARGDRVAALCRRPDQAAELRALAAAQESLQVHPCDVARDESVAEAVAAAGQQLGTVDLLLNNAGTYGDRDVGLEQVQLDEIRSVFEVNTLGPLRVTRAALPLLRSGERKLAVHVTSRMGSIEDNGSGGRYAYRLSKSALNMLCKNMALEHAPEGIVHTVIHPGWVQTDMGGASAPLSIADSVGSMIDSIERFGPEHSGRFFDLHGEPIPW